MRKYILLCLVVNSSLLFSQSSSDNNVQTVGKYIGFNNNFPLSIRTNGIERALFTTGAPLSSWAGNFGDGLRIIAAGGTNAHLDLFTSNTNGGSETHARFGGSGQVSGQNNRFEFISTGASVGNYYSTFAEEGIHRFDRGQIEYGRLGANNHWRFY